METKRPWSRVSDDGSREAVIRSKVGGEEFHWISKMRGFLINWFIGIFFG